MTSPPKIKVVYFDESADTMERFISLCDRKNGIEIVGAFPSFTDIAPLLEQDGYRFLQLLDPDVVVVRIGSANSDDIVRLQALKKSCRVKLVGLLSSECAKDCSLTAAFDYRAEAASADSAMTDEDVYTHLIYRIKTAGLARAAEKAGVKGRWAVLPLPPRPASRRRLDVIVIGASAGGTEALTTILSALPAKLPPILVVQHMPDNFSEFFAKTLSTRVSARVVLAQNGERLEDGTVYLAGCGRHLELVKNANGVYSARCTLGDKVSGHRPSVDVLFRSAAKAAGDAALGIILTGMGSDGAQGLLEMHEAGAYTIGQDKGTCAVYGMPMVAYTLGAVSKQLPLGSIAKAILSAASRNCEEAAKT